MLLPCVETSTSVQTQSYALPYLHFHSYKNRWWPLNDFWCLPVVEKSSSEICESCENWYKFLLLTTVETIQNSGMTEITSRSKVTWSHMQIKVWKNCVRPKRRAYKVQSAQTSSSQWCVMIETRSLLCKTEPPTDQFFATIFWWT